MAAMAEGSQGSFPVLRQVVLDTTDARTLAEFYRQLLGFSYRSGDEPLERSEAARSPTPNCVGKVSLYNTFPTQKGAWCYAGPPSTDGQSLTTIVVGYSLSLRPPFSSQTMTSSTRAP
jgi:Glyoxalase-like domain